MPFRSLFAFFALLLDLFCHVWFLHLVFIFVDLTVYVWLLSFIPFVLGPLGSLFAALGALLAALGRLLGAFWVPFGRSWPPLGRSLALLGGSWEALGRSWGDLGATCKNHQKINAQNDRCWLPKGRPKGAQIDPQTDQNRRQKSMRKKHLLKIVLDPFWSDLGSFSDRS